MSKRINIRPTTSVYATYKNINYEIWTAIAEFVDNSTQSYYSNKDKLENTKYWDGLKVEISYKQDENGEYFLEIVDNAYGMDFNDFRRAIILDSKPPIATRSEFGMGLKTAACWFGLKWSVETTALNEDIKYRAVVDVEHLSKYKNEELEVEELHCNPKSHGTTIRIWNMNRTIKGRSIGKTKAMLAGMYRVDLRTGDIKIFYNDEELLFKDPEVFVEKLNDETEVSWRKEIEFNILHNDQNYPVKGFVGIRNVASTTEAGFTLIRRGRVIIGGFESNYRPVEIFGNSNSFEYQRLFGELRMDNWNVVQTKDNFDWNNGLEDKFIDELKKECEDYIKKARTIRKRKKANVNDFIEAATVALEKTGVITDVKVSDYNKPDYLNEISKNSNESNLQKTELGSEEENSMIFVGNTPKTIDFKIANKDYRFNLVLNDYNEEAQWLKVTFKDNEYTIVWNLKHPFFKQLMEEPKYVSIMQKFILAFVISEVNASKIGENGQVSPDAIRNGMNDILRKISKENKE